MEEAIDKGHGRTLENDHIKRAVFYQQDPGGEEAPQVLNHWEGRYS